MSFKITNINNNFYTSCSSRLSYYATYAAKSLQAACYITKEVYATWQRGCTIWNRFAYRLRNCPALRHDSFEDQVSIAHHLLGIAMTETQERKLIALLNKLKNPHASKTVRQELELFFMQIFREKRFTDRSGLEALDHSPLQEKEKIGNAAVMFLAGMHTTSNLIEFFLNTLITSGYNEKIYKEWKTFITEKKKNNSSANQTEWLWEFIHSSQLVDCCYREVMRLFPIFPIIKRVAKSDFILGTTYIYAMKSN